MSKYSIGVMRIARIMAGAKSEDDKSMDVFIENVLSESEVFDSVLEYEGIIGYGEKIKNWVTDIFKVKL